MIMREEIISCQGDRGRLHERCDFGQVLAGRDRRPSGEPARPPCSGLYSLLPGALASCGRYQLTWI